MMDSGGPPTNSITAVLTGRSEVGYNVIAHDSFLAANHISRYTQCTSNRSRLQLLTPLIQL